MSFRHPCLLRQESFGGTLFNPNNGRRAYVNQVEFELIASAGSLGDLRSLVNAEGDAVDIRRPPKLYVSSFSAPDRLFLELTRGCNITQEFARATKTMKIDRMCEFYRLMTKELLLEQLRDGLAAGIRAATPKEVL